MLRELLYVALPGLLATPVGDLHMQRSDPIRSRLLCSHVPWPTGRSEATTFFVASAEPDTVEVGLGKVEPSTYPGHSGSGRQRAVYGQVFRVDTIGGGNSSELRAEFSRMASPEVVVVPWDYDPACHATYWKKSARWIEPGLTGFFTVLMRPRVEWVGGRPTFDAFSAALQPYPHGEFFKAGYRGTSALAVRESLTPSEFLSLYQTLPIVGSSDQTDGLTAVRSWAAQHPDLANKYPADWILTRVLGSTQK